MATYTAVLLANTAVPSWRAPHKQLPFVFSGAAMAAGGGLTMIFTPVAEAGPTWKMAVAGAAIELRRRHASARDPTYTVIPTRDRMTARADGQVAVHGDGHVPSKAARRTHRGRSGRPPGQPSRRERWT